MNVQVDLIVAPYFTNYALMREGVDAVRVTGIVGTDKSNRTMFTSTRRKVNGSKTISQYFSQYSNNNACGHKFTSAVTGSHLTKADFDAYDAMTKECLIDCVNDLSRSFKMCSRRTGLDAAQTAVVFQTVHEFQKKISDFGSGLVFGTEEKEETAVATATGDFLPVEAMNELDSATINKIIEQLCSVQTGEIVKEAGYEWKMDDSSGKIIILFRPLTAGQYHTKINVQKTVEREVHRAKKRLAFLIDNSDLTEFTANTFYDILSTNGNYIVVKNQNGKERELLAKRFIIEDVYMEAPSKYNSNN